MVTKRFYKEHWRKIRYYINCIKWWFFYRNSISFPRKKNYTISNEWYKNNKILLIAPHADDELLSSYTLLKNASRIAVYYCGFTGSNSSERNREIRYEEIKKICERLKIPFIYGWGTCDNLSQIIGNYNVLVIPSVIDWHPEHRKVSYLLSDILHKTGYNPCIYTYSVTVPTESESAVFCIPMTKTQQNNKYKLFREVYSSQSFMPLYRFIINERISGYQVFSYAAETFRYSSLQKWDKEISMIRKADNEGGCQFKVMFDNLKSIDNLGNIREASKALYELLDRE